MPLRAASLAALEVLVHFSTLPRGHVLTEIEVPDSLIILRIEEDQLAGGWDAIPYALDTQEIGERWVLEARSAVLSVPSSIIPFERNFLINPAHPLFPQLTFKAPSRSGSIRACANECGEYRPEIDAARARP
jgi:RES domain-containing protein